MPEHAAAEHWVLAPRAGAPVPPLVLSLDASASISASPFPPIGLLHRGVERRCQEGSWNDAAVVLARVDAAGSAAREVAFASAVELLAGTPPSPRGEALRGLLVALEQVADATRFFAALVDESGGTAFAAACLTVRERVLDHLEAWTGARIHHDVARIGGIVRDVEPGWLGGLEGVLDVVWDWTDRIDRRLLQSRSWQRATRGLGKLEPSDALAAGLSGANLRASGVEVGGLASHPDGDVFARSWVRLQDLRRTCRMLRDLAGALPVEAGSPPDGPRFPATVPAGEIAVWGAHAGGSFGLHVVSDGGARPWRVHLASSAVAAAAVLPRVLEGSSEEVAELVRLSFWPVWGEAAR